MITIADVKRLWKHADKAYGVTDYSQVRDDFVSIHNKYDLVLIEVDHESKRVIVSFRGTRGLPAWKENFDAIDRVEFKKHEARVHEGFWEGFIAVRDKLWAVIRKWVVEGYTVEFTGHSRGGALCTIAAWRLWVELHISSKCVPFAAPRQGGKRYAAAIEDIDEIEFLNVRTKYDIVTKVPPRALGYTHVDPHLVLHTSAFPFLAFIRGIINHTQKVYSKCINRI